MTRKQFPLLQPGQRIRLTPGGPVREVMRVNACAAYIGYKTPATITTRDGKVVEVMRLHVEAISNRAAVYPE